MIEPLNSTIPVLDLRFTHFRRMYRDIEAIGTWYGAEKRPCLVLMRKGDFGYHDPRRITPCVILSNDAWIFSEEIGDPRRAARMMARHAPKLGIEPWDKRRMTDLLFIVRDCLSDLLKIPPKPRDEMKTVADAVLTNLENGRQIHAEVKDDR